MNNSQHTAFITAPFDDIHQLCRDLNRIAGELTDLANEAGQFTETEIIEKGDVKCTVLVNKNYSIDLRHL